MVLFVLWLRNVTANWGRVRSHIYYIRILQYLTRREARNTKRVAFRNPHQCHCKLPFTVLCSSATQTKDTSRRTFDKLSNVCDKSLGLTFPCFHVDMYILRRRHFICSRYSMRTKFSTKWELSQRSYDLRHSAMNVKPGKCKVDVPFCSDRVYWSREPFWQVCGRSVL